ncbi:MAG: DUF6967 family protein [Hyphomicrobiaceae bacterium]
MSDPKVTDIRTIAAPYRREVVLQDVIHESGMRLLRIRIREGRRFTIMDIDGATAVAWGGALLAWAKSAGDAAVVPEDDAPSPPDATSA